LVSLNADNKDKAAWAIWKKFKAKGITRFDRKTIRGLIDVFEAHHPDIKDCICKDFGVTAMY